MSAWQAQGSLSACAVQHGLPRELCAGHEICLQAVVLVGHLSTSELTLATHHPDSALSTASSPLMGRDPMWPAGYAEDSMWHGLDIADRVRVEWGKHSLVDATKALLRKVPSCSSANTLLYSQAAD